MSATLADAILISLNGEERRVPPGLTVAGLLEQIGLDRRKVAVERNEEIVPRSLYADTALSPGDKLEIVHFIGGG
jgi:sulfur carrier protein